MFRNKAFLLIGLLALAMSYSPLSAALNDDPMRPDIVGWGADATTAPIMGIDNDGDLLPSRHNRYDVGEPTRAIKTVHAINLDVAGGIHSTHETFIQLSSGDVYGMKVTGFVVSTVAVAAPAAATFLDTDITQSSGAPRNVTIYASSAPIVAAGAPFGAGVASTHTLIGGATVYGFDGKGIFTSEFISFSSATISRSTETGAGLCQTQNCNAGGNGMGVGNVAFAYVSSVTVQVSSQSSQISGNIVLVLGYGNKIGLANAITNSSDVYKMTVHRSTAHPTSTFDVSNRATYPTWSINTTYDTLAFPFILDGLKTWDVWYRSRKTY